MQQKNSGVVTIKKYAATLNSGPGVYRMMNESGEVLYVGKAKNLRKRVYSYTKMDRQSIRIQRMISATFAMEFVSTHTEAEALLLESNLIKKFAPKYNILLRDDKSFPFILLTRDHDYPQVLKYRGAQKRKGDYFGPFASVWAVDEALSILQKAFLLRSCTDSIFNNRSRPCLLYQIKRCSAPCVGRISKEAYSELIDESREFLSAGSQNIQKRLAVKMEIASEKQNYEIAAQFRDRIQALTKVQAHQNVNLAGIDEVDVIAAHREGKLTCVQVFFFRQGANFGNRAYFPKQTDEMPISAILEAFIGQFYSKIKPVKIILLSHRVKNIELLEKALELRAGKKVLIQSPSRGEKAKLMRYALKNASEAHSRRMSESKSQSLLLRALSKKLNLSNEIKRLEVYDNSHISGTNAVGVMIVAGSEGFIKKAYRKFSIRSVSTKYTAPISGEIKPGDDYGMMREVLTRRFERLQREDPDNINGNWPDMVLLDGGKGQLNVAKEVLKNLDLGSIAFASIAKGGKRKVGEEKIYLPNIASPVVLESRDPVFYFVQRLRDEAHRFAINAHRQKRAKGIKRSVLDEISGVGKSRKRELLNHFGGPEFIAQAGVADLERVNGISKSLAKKIYDWFQYDQN